METVSAFLAGIVALMSGWFADPVQRPPTKVFKTSEIFTSFAEASTSPALTEPLATSTSSSSPAMPENE